MNRLGAALGTLLLVGFVRANRARQRTERLCAATFETLLNAIDANDAATGAHVRRVAAMALVLADAAGLDGDECRNVERVAIFHDIGKIHEALFDILHEATELSSEEERAIKTHPERGSQVLRPLEAFFPDLREGVIAHHERWDGQGYPRGLRGLEIPLAARIVAIADAFDAITHARRYHGARSEADAIEVIKRGAGRQFDPDLAELFLQPGMLDAIRRAARAARVQPAREIRRVRRIQAAPDLTFRWRTATLAPRSPDRPPRRSR